MQFQDAFPFYMAYPFLMPTQQEREQEKDLRTMQSFYSKTAARIQQKVERECDMMEYDGSLMFDEYPDKFMMEHLCRKIERELEQENQEMDSADMINRKMEQFLERKNEDFTLFRVKNNDSTLHRVENRKNTPKSVNNEQNTSYGVTNSEQNTLYRVGNSESDTPYSVGNSERHSSYEVENRDSNTLYRVENDENSTPYRVNEESEMEMMEAMLGRYSKNKPNTNTSGCMGNSCLRDLIGVLLFNEMYRRRCRRRKSRRFF